MLTYFSLSSIFWVQSCCDSPGLCYVLWLNNPLLCDCDIFCLPTELRGHVHRPHLLAVVYNAAGIIDVNASGFSFPTLWGYISGNGMELPGCVLGLYLASWGVIRPLVHCSAITLPTRKAQGFSYLHTFTTTCFLLSRCLQVWNGVSHLISLRASELEHPCRCVLATGMFYSEKYLFWSLALPLI